MSLVRCAVGKLIVRGGFTESTHGEPVPHDGYVVSRPDAEQRSRRAITTYNAHSLARMIGRYARKHSALLSQPGKYLGGWVDNVGRIYLDVSEHFTDRREALETAIRHNQRAVWDVAAEQEIYL